MEQPLNTVELNVEQVQRMTEALELMSGSMHAFSEGMDIFIAKFNERLDELKEQADV